MVGKGTYSTKEENSRIVIEILSKSAPIAEICRKYNVASSGVYKSRVEFIRARTTAMEPGGSRHDQNLMRENMELKAIIGELTIANETLKKIQLKRGGGRQ